MTDAPFPLRGCLAWLAASLRRAHRLPRMAHAWVWGCAVLAMAAVVAGNALILLQFRQAALDAAQFDVVKLGRVYAEATDRTFQSVDLFVTALAAVLAPLAERGDDAFRNAVTSRSTGDLLAAKRGALPQLSALAVIDAEGRLLLSTGGKPSAPIDVTTRDYFIALRDHPELDRYISAPERNAVTGTWSIFLARRLSGPGGGFGGLVVGAIRVEYFAEFLAAAQSGDGGAVSLWRDDGTLLGRFPGAPGAVAGDAERARFIELTAARRPQAVRVPVGAAQESAIVAARPLRGYPLAVTVSLTEAAALELWRREALVISVAAGVGLIVIGLVAVLVRRHLIAKAQVAEARSEKDLEALARAQLEQAIACAEEAIAEHEVAAAALRESEQRFRDVAEVGADVIWETGPDHRFTFFTGGSAEEILTRIGVTVDTVIGKTRWELAGAQPDSSEAWRNHRADLDAHRPFRQFHYAITRHDRRVVYYAVSGKPIVDSAGRFRGYRGTGTNETAIIEARSRAERAEGLLRDAVESISEGFVIYDSEDRLALCNEAFRNLYPASHREVLVPGTRFEDILRSGLRLGLYADAIGREEEWLVDRMDSHLHPPGPVEARHSSGRWLLICERPMRGGGIAGLRIDVTALKAVQAALRESEERLNRAQRQARMGSDTRDLRTGKMEWSDETYRIFGVARDEFVPTTASFLALVHPDDRKIVLDARAAIDGGAKTSVIEYRLIRPDGSVRYIYRDSEVVCDGCGEPILVAGTVRDITDLRASEARQSELERQLQHSTKMKALGTLAGGIAHDLNNTLVPILSLSKMVAERMPEDSLDREDLDTITFASERARDLLQQLLAFSRNQVSVREGVDLAAVARKALQLVRATAPASVRIVEEIEPVPEIRGDGGALERVFVNLVTNSIQAIGQQPGVVTVTVEPAAAVDLSKVVPAESAVVLSVADTGCGMDPQTIERIFEPFYTTKRVGEGTGLGLSVVHGIITDHGGNIAVESRRRRGTVFRIVLPLSGGAVEPLAALVPAGRRLDRVEATPA